MLGKCDFSYNDFKKTIKFLFLFIFCAFLATDSLCMKRTREEESDAGIEFAQEREEMPEEKRRKEDDSNSQENSSIENNNTENNSTEEDEDDSEEEFSEPLAEDELKKKVSKLEELKTKFFKAYDNQDKGEAKEIFKLIKRENGILVENDSSDKAYKYLSNIRFILKYDGFDFAKKIEIIKWLFGKEGCGYKYNSCDIDWSTILESDVEIIKFFVYLEENDREDIISYDSEDFYESFLSCDDEKIKKLLNIFDKSDIDWNEILHRALQIEDKEEDNCEDDKEDDYEDYEEDDILNLICKKLFEADGKIIEGTVDEFFGLRDYFAIEGDDLSRYIEQKCFRKINPLFAAILSKDLSKVKLLVERWGAKINISSKYDSSDYEFYNYEKETTSLSCQKFYECDEKSNFLKKEIDSDNRKIIKMKAAALEGITPLHLACAIGGCEKIVEYLIEKGADMYAMDYLARTPFLIALEFKNNDYIKILIDKKYNLNFVDFKGRNLLHWACENDDINIDYFLGLVKKKDLQDVNGDTPLHLALKNKFFDNAQKLIPFYTNIELKNKEGKTQIDFLCEYWAIDINLIKLMSKNFKKNENNKRLFPEAFRDSFNPAIVAVKKVLLRDKEFNTPENIVSKKPDYIF